MFSQFVIAEAGSTTLGTFLFVTLSFLLLLFLIKKFAWGSITTILQQRADKIANDLDSAEASRIKAAKLAEERKQQLLDSRNEAQTIVNRAKETADKSGQAIISDAKDEAVNLKEKAKEEVALERKQVLESLKGEIGEVSIQLATKIMQQELTKESHETLINSYIEGLGSGHETR